jgi:hypothetical protein
MCRSSDRFPLSPKAPGEGGKEPEAEEKPRIAAGALPTAASLLRGGNVRYQIV